MILYRLTPLMDTDWTLTVRKLAESFSLDFWKGIAYYEAWKIATHKKSKMGTEYGVKCKKCGHGFRVSEGGGFVFHMLHCDRCGKIGLFCQ